MEIRRLLGGFIIFLMKRELEAADTLVQLKRGRWESEGLFAVMDKYKTHLRCGLLHPPEKIGTVWDYAGDVELCPFCDQITPSVQWLCEKEERPRCMACSKLRF